MRPDEISSQAETGRRERPANPPPLVAISGTKSLGIAL
ncbi:hypothetical protein I547_4668 [Mycobacterium kansasii 824]|uniref:Uncharacterized protein n=1 Tax=Mycobacterium kansasii TaxID=1768 RepID=A0A1V3WME9_MYCKA|nr:hypothetical protein I547_4668 [Mycobacterium kansasii 824]OOK67938.1 hypothetical protein BZL29_6885 [Mycobacterium kansasii]